MSLHRESRWRPLVHPPLARVLGAPPAPIQVALARARSPVEGRAGRAPALLVPRRAAALVYVVLLTTVMVWKFRSGDWKTIQL